MSDPNFSAIRARLRYSSIDEFVEGYGRYISRGGMFVPMSQQKLKPVGTTVRFQFLLADGSSAMLGEGVVRQLKGLDHGSDEGLVGMLVKFTKLSPETKQLVDRVVSQKAALKEGDAEPSKMPEDRPQEEANEEEKQDTGVLAAAEAETLLNQTSEGVSNDSARDREAARKEETTERSVEAFREAHSQLKAEVGGDVEANEAKAVDEADPADDAANEAEAVDDGQAAGEVVENDWFSDATDQAAQSAEDWFSDDLDEGSDHAIEEEPESDGALGFVGDEQSESEDAADLVGEGVESAWDLSGDSSPSEADDQLSTPSQEPPATPDPPVSSSDDDPSSEAPAQEGKEPKALKETEGGIKVMAFEEGEELDEDATREFEAFASGGEDEVDDMFDDVFGGGGDGGGFFGGDDAEGDDFFEAGEDPFGAGDPGEDPFGETPEDGEELKSDEAAASVDAVMDQGQSQDSSESMAADGGDAQPPSMDDDEDDFFAQVDADESEPETESLPPDDGVEEKASEAPDVPDLGFEQEAVDAPDEESGQFDVAAAQEAFGPDDGEPEDETVEAAEESISIRENEGDSSERIQSLLAMDDEEEPEMRLNLGGGSLAEEEEEPPEDDEETDDMASLLASAQEEIDSKKKKKEEGQDDKDILDELLGDDELPPPNAGAAPFKVPQPKSKKKKKGFISKFFDKD